MKKILDLLSYNNLLSKEDLEDDNLSIKMKEYSLDLEHIINIYKTRLLLAIEKKSQNISRFKRLIEDLENNLKRETKTKPITIISKSKHLIVFFDSECSRILGYLSWDNDDENIL